MRKGCGSITNTTKYQEGKEMKHIVYACGNFSDGSAHDCCRVNDLLKKRIEELNRLWNGKIDRKTEWGETLPDVNQDPLRRALLELQKIKGKEMKCVRTLFNGKKCNSILMVDMFKGEPTCINCYNAYIKEVSL